MDKRPRGERRAREVAAGNGKGWGSIAQCSFLLELLLQAQLAGVTALLLAAVRRASRQTCVANAAHFLLLVVLLGEYHQRRLDHTTAYAGQHMQRGGLGDALQAVAIGERLTLSNQSKARAAHALLLRSERADIGGCLGALKIEGDRAPSGRLEEDLHGLRTWLRLPM